MALNIYTLAVITLFLSASSSAGTDGRKVVLGGWQPIKDPKEAKVQEIGKFAVSMYNREYNHDLVYQDVIKGETQTVAGINYRLIISSTDGGVAHDYQAVVFDQPWNDTRILTSFERQ